MSRNDFTGLVWAMQGARDDLWPRDPFEVDTTRAWIYGEPLNSLTTFTYPGHEPGVLDLILEGRHG